MATAGRMPWGNVPGYVVSQVLGGIAVAAILYLIATGKPVTRGRRSHVWEVSVAEESGRLVATGRVRLLILDAGADVAGGKLELPGSRK